MLPETVISNLNSVLKFLSVQKDFYDVGLYFLYENNKIYLFKKLYFRLLFLKKYTIFTKC